MNRADCNDKPPAVDSKARQPERKERKKEMTKEMTHKTIERLAQEMWSNNLQEFAKYDPSDKEVELFATEMLWEITAELNRWLKEDVDEEEEEAE